jgi:hypothetical protein
MAIRQHGLFRLCDRPAPDVAKGGCYFSGDAGPGVDTGILIDFEGTLYLSLNTIRELAEVAGFSVNTEALELERQNAEFQKAIADLRIENGELKSTLDAVGIAVARAAQS